MEWTRAAIAEATRRWLAALPERRAERDLTLVHGSPRDPIWEYVTSADASPEPSFEVHGDDPRPERPHPRPDRVRHVQDGPDRGASRPTTATSLALDGLRALLNPGSVGQPRDGDPRASYLVLDPEAGVADVASGRLRHRRRAGRDARRGLPPRLAERLRPRCVGVRP